MNPVSFYKCLADDTRLKILLLIAQFGELCVCDLVEALGVSQPKISRHLADLRKCGLLQDERRGKWIFYSASHHTPAWGRTVLQETLKHNSIYLDEAVSRLKVIQSTHCCQ